MIAVVLQWLVWLIVPFFAPQWSGTGILGGVFFGLIIAAWWLFFSRAPWSERLGALALMVGAVAATSRLVHESISNGMMGFMPFIYAIPVLSLALVAWAAASRALSRQLRRASMVAAVVLACATLTVIRTDGLTGDADSDLEWRWTPTPEQRLLARADNAPLDVARDGLLDSTLGGAGALPSAPTAATPPESVSAEPAAEPAASSPEAIVPGTAEKRVSDAAWPGFRGPHRDSVVRGVRIETDWSKSPPVELWRRPIGPGWSSFASDGNLIYTQEQRGDEEIVSAYNLTTGAPVWRHSDAARFWESNGGAGPRATPTLSSGRVYTVGGTGILNALDARDGSVVWSRNVASDTRTQVPPWGIASSPLVIGDLVIAAAAGSLAGYDAATGNPRWLGPTDGWGYSSPHLWTIDGVAQVVLLNGAGAIGVAPSDGTLLWTHAWPSDGMVQPAMIEGGDFLIGSGSGLSANTGMQRVTVARNSGKWAVTERWTSNGLKPYFNDFVVHNGHAFGFDGSILACIDLNDGTRQWKGGRYGHGQMILLPDQDVLLVLSEQGELALVRAAPDGFAEIARVPAIEGKTWNHPVLAGNILLVRNGEEMAAFRLSLSSR
jgi:outer membrane protein assembly factor BamB